MVVRARDCRGRGAACHRDRVSSRTYTLVPTALVRAGPRSSAPAVIRCGFVRKFVTVRVQCGACCARLHIHIPMPIPIPNYVYSYTHICMCATRMHLSNLRKLIRCVSRATRMHLSNLRKLIRCVFLREAHLTKMIR